MGHEQTVTCLELSHHLVWALLSLCLWHQGYPLHLGFPFGVPLASLVHRVLVYLRLQPRLWLWLLPFALALPSLSVSSFCPHLRRWRCLSLTHL